MTQPSPKHDTPFGTSPQRSRAPLIILGLLYLAWSAALLWMAVAHSGR